MRFFSSDFWSVSIKIFCSIFAVHCALRQDRMAFLVKGISASGFISEEQVEEFSTSFFSEMFGAPEAIVKRFISGHKSFFILETSKFNGIMSLFLSISFETVPESAEERWVEAYP